MQEEKALTVRVILEGFYNSLHSRTKTKATKWKDHQKCFVSRDGYIKVFEITLPVRRANMDLYIIYIFIWYNKMIFNHPCGLVFFLGASNVPEEMWLVKPYLQTHGYFNG